MLHIRNWLRGGRQGYLTADEAKAKIDWPDYQHVDGKTTWVYAFSYDYLRLAERRLGFLRFVDPQAWPIKIGRTQYDPALRIGREIGENAGLYQAPVVHCLFELRPGLQMPVEAAVHARLDAASKRLDGGMGIEWFSTNKEEIEAIFRSLTVEELKTGWDAAKGCGKNPDDDEE